MTWGDTLAQAIENTIVKGKDLLEAAGHKSQKTIDALIDLQEKNISKRETLKTKSDSEQAPATTEQQIEAIKKTFDKFVKQFSQQGVNGIITECKDQTCLNKDNKEPFETITYDAEGNDDPDSIWYSRRPHVPSSSSGVTIGRGYDMRDKTKSQIERDLKEAGINEQKAKLFSEAAGLKGKDAKDFLKENELNDYEISEYQQRKLFQKSYSEKEEYTKYLYNKTDVVKTYGESPEWDKLNPTIREILVDLTYRGDYDGKTRKKIQEHIVKNDLEGLATVINDRDYWQEVRPGLPNDRFNRRADLINGAINK